MSLIRPTLRLYWREVRQYKISLFIMLVGIPMSAVLLEVAMPYVLTQAVGALTRQQTDQLWPLLWAATGLGVAGALANLAGIQAAISHESKVRADLSVSTLRRLLAHDMAFFTNHKVGNLIKRYGDFIDGHINVQYLFVIRTSTFFISAFVGVAVVWWHSWVLGLIAGALIVLLGVMVQASLRVRAPARHARKRLLGEVSSHVADTLSNHQTVKTFAAENQELAITADATQRYRRMYRRDFRPHSVEIALRLWVTAFAQVVAVAVAAWLLMIGQLDIGVAIFVVAYLQRVAGQAFAIGEIINGYDKIFLQTAPMADLLHLEPSLADRPEAGPLRLSGGDIRFDQVDFGYRDGRSRLFDHFSLHIPAGQRVGLVGASGSGKTTLTKLLLRFADVDGGVIRIDGQDIAGVTQASLRQAIAYVPQEPLLFHRSVRANIAYGRPGASEAEVMAAAQQAGAYEFIQQLPQGLDTLVGERGVKLSGGQRQRIAIARAILKDAPILVLDEATSALDSESERLIQRSLEGLMQGRTALVIAHRLSTIAQLDRIVVMEAGRIVEDGTHQELLARGGVYAGLWARQSHSSPSS